MDLEDGDGDGKKRQKDMWKAVATADLFVVVGHPCLSVVMYQSCTMPRTKVLRL